MLRGPGQPLADLTSRLEPLPGKLRSRGHAELTKHLFKMVLHGCNTDVELGGDFLIGGTVRRQLRNPLFLGRQVVASFDGSFSSLFPGRMQFRLGALCERFHSEG